MKYVCDVSSSALVIDLLATQWPLSKSQIKVAMNKGALWLQRGKKQRRFRRVKAQLKAGDKLTLYYDESLLKLSVAQPVLLQDRGAYSVWLKPAGVLSQGTKYGDHCSLLRQVELLMAPNKKVFLIHRLDREAIGLMLIAHDAQAAASLSQLFSQHRIEKHYRIQVRGQAQDVGCFEDDLDGKIAKTMFQLIHYDAEKNISTLNVQLEGGRYHQIRRHFDMHALSVMGDPRYGKHNKNHQGLALCAYKLVFVCPLSQQPCQFEMSDLPF